MHREEAPERLPKRNPETNRRRIVRTLAALLCAGLIAILAGCEGMEAKIAKYSGRGARYLAEKNYEKARVEFKNVMQIDPKDATGAFSLGKTEEADGNLGKAFAWYSKSLELDPNYVDAKIKLARMVAGFNPDQAKELNNAALAVQPDNIDGQINVALILVRQNDLEAAILKLKQVIAANPDNADAPLMLALLYGKQGNINQQQETLLCAVRANPGNIDLLTALAQVYYKTKNYAQAEEQLKAIIASEPHTRNVAALAALYSLQNEVSKGESLLREHIRQQPDDQIRTGELAGYLVKHHKIDEAISGLQSAIQRNPDFEDLPFLLADAYIGGGKPDKAESTYLRLIEDHKIDPIALRARIALAVLYLKQQKQDQAVELLDQVLEENPKDNQALLTKGQLALQRGATENAIGLLRRVLQDQPENAKLHGLLAQALLRDNKTNLARDHLEKAVMLAPSDTTYRLQLANVLTLVKDYDRALNHVEFVLQTTPDTLEALQVKTDILGMKGDRQGALATLREIQTAHPGLADADFRLGHLYLADKKFDAAVAEFEGTLEKLPDSEMALAGLVDTFIAAGESAKAENRIKKFIADNPGNSMVLTMLGRLYVSTEQYPEAIQTFKQVIAEKPDFPSAMTSLIGAYRAQNQIGEVESYLLKLVADNPNHSIASTFLAVVHLSNNQYEQAELDLKQSIAVNPEWGYSYGLLGSLYSKKLNQTETAMATYRDGMTADPKNLQLPINLALLYQQTGDIESAIELYYKRSQWNLFEGLEIQCQ